MAHEDLSKLKELRDRYRRLPSPEWERVSKSLDSRTLARLRNYDYGLTTEEEFHYIVKLLQHTSKIQPIEQARRDDDSSIPSDYFVVFHKEPPKDPEGGRDSISCLIEVKRAWQFKWRISRRDFDRRVRYARTRGLQLFFALKFCAENSSFWTMLSASYVSSRNLKVDPGAIMASVFDVLTGNFQIHLPSAVVEEIYEKRASGLVLHPEYGALTGLRVRVGNKVVETSTSVDWRLLLFAFSPALRARRVEGGQTIARKSYESQMISAHHAVDSLMCVVHNLESDADRHSFRIRWLSGKAQSPVTIEHIWALARDMETAGVVQPFRMVPDLERIYPDR